MNVLKSIIFYPMMWLRPIVILVGNGLAGFLLLGALLFLAISFFSGGSEEDKATFMSVFILPAFGMSFFCFLVTFLYDRILLALNPTGVDLYLGTID